MMEKIRIAVVERRKVTHGQDWYKRSEGETYYVVNGVEERAVLMPFYKQGEDLTINEQYAISKCISEGKKEFKDTFDDYESWEEHKVEYEEWKLNKLESNRLQQKLGDDFTIELIPSSDMCPVKLSLKGSDLDETKEAVRIYKMMGIMQDINQTDDANTIINYLHSYYRKLMYKLPYTQLNDKHEYAYFDASGKYDHSMTDVITLRRRNLFPIDISIELHDFNLLYELLRSGARKSERVSIDKIISNLIERLKTFAMERDNARFRELCQNLTSNNCHIRELETLYSIADRYDMNIYNDIVGEIKKIIYVGTPYMRRP